MSHSQKLFDRAKQLIPGGVNSPGRAFINVGGNPIFIESGQGAYLTDVDGQVFLEYVGSMGPNIVGNAHPDVVSRVKEQTNKGIGFWLPTEIELELVEKIEQLMPSMELIRMVNSGTEATMSAIRVARAFTKRDKIIKFEGCYHGHNDDLLVQSGSATLDIGVPSSPGVPASTTQNTLVAQYNNLASVEQVFADHSGEIAAIIVEPVAGNMNCVPPAEGFLAGLRALCDKHNALLIFDEVMTGFRVARGGAQALYNIKPDLTTIGKIIGGGLPVGAFGGRKDIMSLIAPAGPVYHAGTLSGNPISVAAGLATLEIIEQPGFFDKINAYSDKLAQGLLNVAAKHEIPLVVNYVGGMFGIFFTDKEHISSFKDVMSCDQERFKQFFLAMRERGVLLAPSAFECGFFSCAHGDEELSMTLEAADSAFSAMKIGQV